MGWFFHRAPPPPPPKSKIPRWVNISVPIIFAVMIGLLGIVYNGLADELKKKADKAITVEQIGNNQKLLEAHQEALDSTLKVITEIQAEKTAREKYHPVGRLPSSQPAALQPAKPPLSPGDYQQYMKMSPADRAGFRSLHPSYQSLPK